MAASNQARARRGASNTAVSDTSSWAMENRQSKPARRSSIVKGSGMTAIMRRSRSRTWPAPSRAQMRCAASGSETERRPLSRASKPTPALANWHLAHSCPLAHAHSG